MSISETYVPAESGESNSGCLYAANSRTPTPAAGAILSSGHGVARKQIRFNGSFISGAPSQDPSRAFRDDNGLRPGIVQHRSAKNILSYRAATRQLPRTCLPYAQEPLLHFLSLLVSFFLLLEVSVRFTARVRRPRRDVSYLWLNDSIRTFVKKIY